MLSAQFEEIFDAPVRTDLDSHEKQEVEACLLHPGFRHLLGLMFGARQGEFQLLANTRVNDMATAQALGVIQGKVLALDILRHNAMYGAGVPADQDEGHTA